MTGSSTHSKTEHLLCWLGLVLLVSTSAFGAPSKGQAGGERAARGRFAKATQAYNLGQFEEALKAYKEVYELKPHPAFLFNIAQCYRQLADYPTAAFYYRRYRNEARLNSSDARVVNELIAEVEAKQAEREEQQRAQAEAARLREIDLARAAAKAEAAAATQVGGLVVLSPKAPVQESHSVFKKWWFWTAAGVIVTSAAIYYSVPLHPRTTTLGDISARPIR